MKTLKEYLEQSLLQHIAIELQEDDPIYEKYGLYDGCKDLASFLVLKIKQNINKEEICIQFDELTGIDNIIFNKLYINLINSDEIIAEYDLDQPPIIDYNTKRFDKCRINIYGMNSNFGTKWKQLEYILEHELTHIYNDYKLQIKSLKSFLDIFQNDDAYSKSKSYIYDTNKNFANLIKKSIYLLNNYEQNAFIAQFIGQIGDIKKEYLKTHKQVDANQFLKEIKQIDIYKEYETIGWMIQLYDNHRLFKRDIESIKNEWFLVTGQQLDIDKIFNIIKKKFVKFKNKIESYIPKKIAEAHGKYHLSIM